MPRSPSDALANSYTGITITLVIRPPLSNPERDRGQRLGRLLRQARGTRSMAQVASAAGLSTETLRKIETGRVPTPAFFTVAALATVLGISLDNIAQHCHDGPALPAAGGQALSA
jgi:DNA-binding phage protein